MIPRRHNQGQNTEGDQDNDGKDVGDVGSDASGKVDDGQPDEAESKSGNNGCPEGVLVAIVIVAGSAVVVGVEVEVGVVEGR